MNRRQAGLRLAAAFVATACRSTSVLGNPGPEGRPAEATRSPEGPATSGAELAQKPGAENRYVAAAFDALRAQYGDLSFEDLVGRLGLQRAVDSGPRLDPTRVAYYDKVRTALKLTPEEEAIYRTRGLVGVDHAQRYSMGSLYYAVYTRDLPVLITTDSILHAMHRSFDAISCSSSW